MGEGKNYRGLMINATAIKVLIMVILARLKAHYERAILPSQFGFRAYKSTTEGVFVARKITSKSTEPMWGCFVDLKAAYDWVDRATMWRVLRERLGEQGGELVDVLEKLYTKITAKLQGFKKESCMLFNYRLDTVIRFALHDIEKEYPGAGIKFNYNISDECTDRAQRRKDQSRGNLLAKLILYADDILEVARSKEELEGMMQIITKHFTEFGLRVAESKTVTMTWRTTPDIQEATTLISLNGKDLENVRPFRYLGHWLTNDPKQPKYLNQQVTAAQGTWSKDRRFYSDKELWKRVYIHG